MTRSDQGADYPADHSTDRGADLPARRRKSRGLPILLVTVATLGAAQAAAWFYFRSKQPMTDELTRERLRRWSDK